MHYDVAIVGVGSAGSTAAKILSKKLYNSNFFQKIGISKKSLSIK